MIKYGVSIIVIGITANNVINIITNITTNVL